MLKIILLLYVVAVFLLLVKLLRNPTNRTIMSTKFLLGALIAIALILFIAYFQKNVSSSILLTSMFSIVSPPLLHIRYGIMFDAGSTGSRMHVFRFNMSNSAQSFVLDDSLFVAVKPGLSSYAKNPSEAAESLKTMLGKAKSFIPESQWSTTPIALKATAGLRLLSREVAKSILFEVEKLFRKYPFNLSETGISVLEGSDEGLFSWFTVNYLTGRIENLSNTYGVLDLGGGSTQITFPLKAPLPLSEHTIDVQLFGENHPMYTRSYLGMGMMSARFQILGGVEKVSGDITPQELSSPCLPLAYSGTWNYRGQNHNIRSSANSTNRFGACKLKAREMLEKYNIDKPPEHEFYAISFFFDSAVDQGAIKNLKEGTELKIELFQSLTENACMASNVSTVFQCLDLCYITSLLTDGYGFNASKSLTLKKEINGFEIAWPLGAMFEVYEKFTKLKKKTDS